MAKKNPINLIKEKLYSNFVKDGGTLDILLTTAEDNLEYLSKPASERDDEVLSRKDITEMMKDMGVHAEVMEDSFIEIQNLIEDNINSSSFMKIVKKFEDLWVQSLVDLEYINQKEIKRILTDLVQELGAMKNLAEAMYNLLKMYKNELTAAASYRSEQIVKSYIKGWMTADARR